MMALSRDVLRWVQGLNLSYSIKNAKRDFANGFLIAEILSKYFPNDVAMHAYDTGTGAAAKKNNWDLLERVFSKLGIPVHKDMVSNVAAGRAEAAALVLSIIYTNVRKRGPVAVSRSSSAVPRDDAQEKFMGSTIAMEVAEKLVRVLPKTGKTAARAQHAAPSAEDGSSPDSLETQGLAPAPLEKVQRTPHRLLQQQNSLPQDAANMISTNVTSSHEAAEASTKEEARAVVPKTNAPAVVLVHSKSAFHTLHSSDKDLEEYIGKIAILKVICSLFGVQEQQMSFGRSSFSSAVCRDKLLVRLDAFSGQEISELPATIMAKERELALVIQHSPPSDVLLLYDTLLPALVAFAADSSILNAAATILVIIADLLHLHSPTKDLIFQRFTASKDFAALLTHTMSANLTKMPAVARILLAFMGPDLADAEKVKMLLQIKGWASAASSTSAKFPAGSNVGAGTIGGNVGANGGGKGFGVVSDSNSASVLPVGLPRVSESGNRFILFMCAQEMLDSRALAMENSEGEVRGKRDGCQSTQDLENMEAVHTDEDGGPSIPDAVYPTNQFTTLVLSECLTVINTHRRHASQGKCSMLFSSIFSTYELSAAFLLLAKLAKSENPTRVQDRKGQKWGELRPENSVPSKDDGIRLEREAQSRPTNSGRVHSRSGLREEASIGHVPTGVIESLFSGLTHAEYAATLAGNQGDGRSGGFMRVIMHQDCPSHLQKAFIYLVAVILQVVGEAHSVTRIAREAAVAILKWVADDVLRTALILFAPCLRSHFPLCASFVRGLTSIDEGTRLDLLHLLPPPQTRQSSNQRDSTSITTMSGVVNLLDIAEAGRQSDSAQANRNCFVLLDLPFAVRQEHPNVVDSWYAYGVAMGVVRVVSSSKVCFGGIKFFAQSQISKVTLLPRCFLQVLLAASLQLKPLIGSSPLLELDSPSQKHSDPWDRFFSCICPDVVASFVCEDTVDLAGGVIESFLHRILSDRFVYGIVSS
ncbi:hypothetical protein DFJ73DRAFT_815433 [Zopfochytrium polystomum]|nr:hypothetical protein DFJ73DRAFT_815433 [Zopfochytrium polystomum]